MDFHAQEVRRVRAWTASFEENETRVLEARRSEADQEDPIRAELEYQLDLCEQEVSNWWGYAESKEMEVTTDMSENALLRTEAEAQRQRVDTLRQEPALRRHMRHQVTMHNDASLMPTWVCVRTM